MWRVFLRRRLGALGGRQGPQAASWGVGAWVPTVTALTVPGRSRGDPTAPPPETSRTQCYCVKSRFHVHTVRKGPPLCKALPSAAALGTLVPSDPAFPRGPLICAPAARAPTPPSTGDRGEAWGWACEGRWDTGFGPLVGLSPHPLTWRLFRLSCPGFWPLPAPAQPCLLAFLESSSPIPGSQDLCPDGRGGLCSRCRRAPRRATGGRSLAV